jgi:hypothetical protein
MSVPYAQNSLQVGLSSSNPVVMGATTLSVSVGQSRILDNSSLLLSTTGELGLNPQTLLIYLLLPL